MISHDFLWFPMVPMVSHVFPYLGPKPMATPFSPGAGRVALPGLHRLAAELAAGAAPAAPRDAERQVGCGGG